MWDMPSKGSLMIEEWRPVDDWPDYEVSSHGRVRRTTSWGRATAGAVRKPVFISGYAAVTLTHRSGRRKMMLIHRLVAKAFLPSPPLPRMEVNHKDADRANPRAHNLEWVTPSQNRRHGYIVGKCNAVGEANGYSKLTDDGVRDIRQRACRDRSNWPELAEEFGVSASTVRDVVTLRTWVHV
ncbi:HNH endonuclease [Xanthobacteraceae bacterium A53D]